MRKLLVCLVLGMTSLSGASNAQVTLNMAQVTCADSQALPPDQSRIFSAWMSGWFNYKFGYSTVGMTDFERNTASVKQWCVSNPRTTIMAALERAHPQPGPPTGQVKIDMSLLTCKQYLGSDPDRQEMVAAWMSGYFRASRDQPVVDFQRFANNKRAVANYCKKRGNETLMSAIQNTVK